MFKSPPDPPRNSEQFLQELIDYYRALLDYHQREAAMAASSLAHLEALLNRSPTLAQQQQITLELVAASNSQRAFREQNVSTAERAIGPLLPTLEEIEQLLTANRGKMLHLDYLVRVLCGRLEDQQEESVTVAIAQLLERGASQGRWSAIPDSPDCWTIDLKDFPDLVPTPKSDKSRSRKKLISRLPLNEKLDQYNTLTEAILACLQNNVPKSMSVSEILDWFYPEGLSLEEQPKAKEAIKDVIIKKCGLPGCWKRVETGRYALNLPKTRKRKS
jgi:hypothetical protein